MLHLTFTHRSYGSESLYVEGAEVVSGTRSGGIPTWSDCRLILANRVRHRARVGTRPLPSEA